LAFSLLSSDSQFRLFNDGPGPIEGHGVDPDLVVDNLPHVTYQGEDAQLKAAVATAGTNPAPTGVSSSSVAGPGGVLKMTALA